jgi:hypothetical protein
MEVRGLRPKFARPAAPGCHSHRTRSDLYSLSPMRHRRHSPSGRRHCPPLPAAGRHRCAPPVLLRPKCCPPVMAADHPRQGHDAHRLPAVLSSAPGQVEGRPVALRPSHNNCALAHAPPPPPAAGRHRRAPPVLLHPECRPPASTANLLHRGHATRCRPWSTPPP